ncbi:MAG: metallophosphoesterase [Kofleriaceae bacterium]
MDPEAHVVAAIDLLLTIGYIDGHLHEGEQALIQRYLHQLVELTPGSAAAVDAAYARLEAEIKALAAEPVETTDATYTTTRLKVRAVSLFRAFSPADQRVALELMTALSHADGTVDATERELHDELLAYFHAVPHLPAPHVDAPAELLRIEPARVLPLAAPTHPALDAVEHPYSQDSPTLLAQFQSDYNLIFQTIGVWEQQRSRGNGRLLGVTDISQLAPGTRLLDGHVHVIRPDHPTELVVLGDLHGCYGCLKAALLQSNFIERASLHQQDPASHPDVKLVLLGDYLDRGRFGFEGVLRAALQLQGMLPDHVILLRGNHEYLVRMGAHVVSAVNPAEAVPAISDRAPPGILDAYRHLFEHMPTALFFERTFLVHGGIPRDETLAERYRDFSSLGDPVMRFEMMWSDPEQTDHVPVELQRASSRFSFGRAQFRDFIGRIGCHAMIRGHEQVDQGFITTFDLGSCQLHTLFSAGGRDNPDLPTDSRYRNVTPMALTIRWDAGVATAFPWVIDYLPFASPEHNGLLR